MDKRLRSSETSSIEQLPNEVLLIVLSHLNLAEIVRSSILSRRWRHLWRYITCLNFDATVLLPRNLLYVSHDWYVSWVNNVIDARSAFPGSPLVKELRIQYELESVYSHHIDRWIQFAIANRVEKLHLEFGSYISIIYPEEQYKLSEESWHRAPSGLASLKYLKSLFLSCVNVSKQFIEFILSSCPLLEDLLLDCAGPCGDLNVSSEHLRRLNISLAPDCVLTNLCAPRLASLYYDLTNLNPQKIDVPMLSDLTIGDMSGSRRITRHLTHFWTCLPQLEKLELLMKKKQRFRWRQMPQLVNLKYLKIKVYWDTNRISTQIMEFIDACPLLKTFALEIDCDVEDISSPLSTRRNGRNQHNADTSYSLKSLKVLELCCSEPNAIDQEVIKCVARNAPHLEKLNLHRHRLFANNIELFPDTEIDQVIEAKAKQLLRGMGLENKVTVGRLSCRKFITGLCNLL